MRRRADPAGVAGVRRSGSPPRLDAPPCDATQG